ncbi:MAG TPA: hypothetical protein VH761_09100, partial [Ilumatobacteraceae bacterium]
AVGLVAAATAAAVSFLDFGGRAEAHRRSAAAYKDILRSFELWCASRASGGNVPFDLADLKARLGEVDAAAPTVPRRLADRVEHEPCEWIPTAEGLSAMAPPASSGDDMTATVPES